MAAVKVIDDAQICKDDTKDGEDYGEGTINLPPPHSPLLIGELPRPATLRGDQERGLSSPGSEWGSICVRVLRGGN